MVIGFGINCASHPSDLPATDLAACGIKVSPGELHGLLSAVFEEWLARWDRGRGFAAIRQAWLAHAQDIGSPIVARLPDREIRGTFAGIDESGYLILRRDGSAEMRIGAADIFSQSA